MIYPLVSNPFDQNDIETLISTIKGGQLTMGPQVKSFEKKFSEKMGVKYSVMVNSGSSANLIAAFATLYKKNNPLAAADEVLVPAIGWSTTWAPLHQAGFQLKVVDVDPETLNVDAQDYIDAVTPKTKMIVTVSILGNPLEFEKLRNFCDQKSILLFEDNCESIGATHKGRQCGTFGHLGTYSFFYTHHISTMEGGMVVTDDEELYHILIALRAHGWVRDLPAQSALAEADAIENKNKYQFVLPGFNVRPLDLSGALGHTQLAKLDHIVEMRRKNAEIFKARMSQFSDRFAFQKEKHGQSSWYSFTIVIKNGSVQKRNALMKHLTDHKIESRMITGGCLTLHPMKKYFKFSEAAVPIEAERIHNSGIFVANHAVDMTDMFDALESALKTFKD
jgi:CDP-6-deoxy-D-xylo-4-hexulose-3-dehydrase